jgi:TRAP-type C4-dicarboxylate transport system permease small subunit
MQDLVIGVSRRLSVLARVALWISGTGLVLMTAAVAWQVFGRYVLNATPIWTEVTSVLLMGWFIFLGAAVGIREGYHLSFDILLYALPRRAKEVLYTISDLLVAAFAAGMTIYGIELSIGTWRATIPAIGLSGGCHLLRPRRRRRPHRDLLARTRGASPRRPADRALRRNRPAGGIGWNTGFSSAPSPSCF